MSTVSVSRPGSVDSIGSDSPGESALRIRDLCKDYELGSETVRVLQGINLDVPVGDYVAIMGPSGSGKSTLLNLVGCLDRPTAGEYHLGGQDVATLSDDELSAIRARSIGFVFQAYNLIPVLTAFENAEAVIALQGVPAAERKIRVMAILKEVGLEGMEDRRPNELSGGQQQRVAIARAIASNPAVILADEPTANVDSETAEKLLSMMAKLNEEKGITFIFSTHDPRVMKYARRLIGVVDGRVDSDKVKKAGEE